MNFAHPGAGRRTQGFWRLADPKISLASMASILLASLCAAGTGKAEWVWLLPCVAGIFFLEVAKNASGEVFDWDSGTDIRVQEKDRSPFSGGKRVLVDRLLTRGETWTIAIAGYLLSIGTGLTIAALRDNRVLWFGLIGTALAYFYHGGPVRLSYRGLGEAAVAVAYGPLIACGTHMVLTGEIPEPVAVLSVLLGLLIAAFLWINEFPDFEADRASGKRTLVVRLGRRKASYVYVGLMAAGFGLLVVYASWLGNIFLLLGLAGLVPAYIAARITWRHPEETARLIPAQGYSLLAFLGYAAGSGAGCWLGQVAMQG